MSSAEGGGFTWSANSRENQITPWSNDPVTDRPGEAFYLRDDETGALWSPTALPIRDQTATYIARYDDLFNGKDEKIDVSRVDVSMNGIELQDREFVAAIREGREPNASVAQVLPCYEVLHQLEQQLA